MVIDPNVIEAKMAYQGFNFTQLAQKCGVSRQTLSVIKGRGTCKPETAGKIAKALDCKIEELQEC